MGDWQTVDTKFAYKFQLFAAQPCQNRENYIFFAPTEHQPKIVSIEWNAMTMDQSLKVKAGAIKARNVLTRAERIAQLKKLDKFDEESSVVGMPKVRVMKVSLKKKKKVKKADDEEKS